MGILAEQADQVVGVDTHRDSHSAAIVDAVTGAVVIDRTVSADAFGHKRLLRFAKLHATGRRVWAIESSGSYGAGLTTFLLAHGEWVVEVERPVRPARRNGAKSDELDAIRAAREALTRDHLAQPRRRGDREAVRVLLVTRRGAMHARTRAINHLKALIVTAREELRHQLRRHDTDELIARCARLRTLPSHSAEHRATVIALRHTARRILTLEAEANDLETEIEQLIKTNVPWLLAEVGVGPITAAQLFCSWSHPGRLRSDAAFCMLGGAAPIPASSGQTVRYRLNRGGDRQLNCALHTIVLTRLKHDPATRAYAAKRAAEGKTPREIKRCLKRYVARHLFRLLEANGPDSPSLAHPAVEPSASAIDKHRSLLATALAVCACQQGRRVRFTTLAALANELQEAESRRELGRVVGRYARTELVCLDELGYLNLPEGAAELVFQVISERNERGSLIVTTNLPFGDWTKVFPDPRLAKAVVDRITHKAHIIDTGNESWRFRHGLERQGRKRP